MTNVDHIDLLFLYSFLNFAIVVLTFLSLSNLAKLHRLDLSLKYNNCSVVAERIERSRPTQLLVELLIDTTVSGNYQHTASYEAKPRDTLVPLIITTMACRVLKKSRYDTTVHIYEYDYTR